MSSSSSSVVWRACCPTISNSSCYVSDGKSSVGVECMLVNGSKRMYCPHIRDDFTMCTEKSERKKQLRLSVAVEVLFWYIEALNVKVWSKYRNKTQFLRRYFIGLYARSSDQLPFPLSIYLSNKREWKKNNKDRRILSFSKRRIPKK